jgi:hypothetical protein
MTTSKTKKRSNLNSTIEKDLEQVKNVPVRRKYRKRTTSNIETIVPRSTKKRFSPVDTGRNAIVHLGKNGEEVRNVFIDEQHASSVLGIPMEDIQKRMDINKPSSEYFVTVPVKGAFNQRKIERLAIKKIREVSIKKNVSNTLSQIDFSKLDARVVKKINQLIENSK